MARLIAKVLFLSLDLGQKCTFAFLGYIQTSVLFDDVGLSSSKWMRLSLTLFEPVFTLKTYLLFRPWTLWRESHRYLFQTHNYVYFAWFRSQENILEDAGDNITYFFQNVLLQLISFLFIFRVIKFLYLLCSCVF